MRVSYKCDYALKVLLELTLSAHKGVVSSQELADRLDIPVKFLEQVMTDLRKGGFVESRRGNTGGYSLVGNPAKITVGQVVRHIEGRTEPIECINPDYKNCRDIETCVFKNVWARVDQAVNNVLDNVSLETLAQDTQKQAELNYSI